MIRLGNKSVSLGIISKVDNQIFSSHKILIKLLQRHITNRIKSKALSDPNFTRYVLQEKRFFNFSLISWLLMLLTQTSYLWVIRIHRSNTGVTTLTYQMKFKSEIYINFINSRLTMEQITYPWYRRKYQFKDFSAGSNGRCQLTVGACFFTCIVKFVNGIH